MIYVVVFLPVKTCPRALTIFIVASVNADCSASSVSASREFCVGFLKMDKKCQCNPVFSCENSHRLTFSPTSTCQIAIRQG